MSTGNFFCSLTAESAEIAEMGWIIESDVEFLEWSQSSGFKIREASGGSVRETDWGYA
jgi:hypothetical protein